MYLQHLLWASFLFLAIVGYGSLVQNRLASEIPMNWGVKFCLGIGVIMSIGGVLLLCRLATSPVLSAVVMIGFFLWVFLDARNFRLPRYKEDYILWIILLFSFGLSIAWPYNFDGNDDYIIYLALPEKLLQTGTLLEPFSVRRALAFGGHTLLQSLTFIVGDISSGHIVDSGFGTLAIFGVLTWITRSTPKKYRWMRFCLLLFVLLIPFPRIHTGSHALGTAMLLALIAFYKEASVNLNKKNLIILALILSGVGTLRATFLVIGPGIITVLLLYTAMQQTKNWKVPISNLLIVGIFTSGLLLSWMIVQYQSSGNFIFPLQMGYANADFVFGGTQEGKLNDSLISLGIVMHPFIGLLFVVSVLPLFITKKTDIYIYLIPSILVIFVTTLSCYKMAGSGFYDIYRYVFPMLFFSLLWSLVGIINSHNPSKALISCVVVAVVGCFILFLPDISRHQVLRITALQNMGLGLPASISNYTAPYVALQALTPEGSTIFTVVTVQTNLNFKRNNILNADILGGAGPNHGFPLGKGSDALEKYLATSGVDYVMAVSFDTANGLYSRKLWEDHPRPEWYWKAKIAPVFLDIFDNIDALSDSNPTYYANGVRLIKLKKY